MRSYRMSLDGQVLLSRGLALVGFGLLAKVLLETGIVGAGGTGGTDANDYWVAARHVLDGQPLYEARYGTYLAYSYPPLFAELLAPFAALPMPAFVWGWRLLELVCLRYTVGGWTRAGMALLIPPVVAEIETGNIHLLVAAVCAVAMRGSALPIAPAAVLKFAAVPLVPLGLAHDRRGLLLGAGVAAIAVGGSIAIAPHYWPEYGAFLSANQLPEVPAVALTVLPLPVRLAIATGLGLAALRYVRLAPVAVVLAYPVVWATSLSTLVAVAAMVPSPRGVPAWSPRRAWPFRRTDAAGIPSANGTVPSGSGVSLGADQ